MNWSIQYIRYNSNKRLFKGSFANGWIFCLAKRATKKLVCVAILYICIAIFASLHRLSLFSYNFISIHSKPAITVHFRFTLKVSRIVSYVQESLIWILITRSFRRLRICCKLSKATKIDRLMAQHKYNANFTRVLRLCIPIPYYNLLQVNPSFNMLKVRNKK